MFDPDGLPLTLLREPDGSPAQIRLEIPGDAQLVAQVWVAQVAGCRCCCSTPTSRTTREPLREVTDRLYGGRPSTAAPGAAAGRRRGPRPARLPRVTGAAAPEVFHTNEGHAGFLGLERIRELTVAEGRPGLRHGLEVDPRRHGVHHAHAGPGGHRPVPAGADRAVLRGAESPVAGVPVDRILRAGRRGLPRAATRRLQHGGDGLPARPARQRRSQAARRGQPRDVQRAVAGVRRDRGADHLDHQRRARPDLGRPRGLRAGQEGGRGHRVRRPDVWSVVDKIPAADLWSTKRALRAGLVEDARGRLRKSWLKRGRPRPSWAGSTAPSTPTCSPSASRGASRRTSG